MAGERAKGGKILNQEIDGCIKPDINDMYRKIGTAMNNTRRRGAMVKHGRKIQTWRRISQAIRLVTKMANIPISDMVRKLVSIILLPRASRG